MNIEQTAWGMDITMSRQDFIELQDFFAQSVAMTFEALPARFSIPVKLTHIPINLEELCGA